MLKKQSAGVFRQIEAFKFSACRVSEYKIEVFKNLFNNKKARIRYIRRGFARGK